MAEHKILVLKNSPNQCVVWPPYQLVVGNDKVTWTNLTGDKIDVTFDPQRHPYDNDNPLNNIPDTGKKTKKVHGSPASGRYPYRVWCQATRSYAEGGSDGEVDV